MISFLLGWSYFLSWSFSFYPQIYLNYKRKAATGISKLFMMLNIIGFYTYSLYTLKATSLISQSDKGFAFHALIMSFIVYVQYMYYHGTSKMQLICLAAILVLLHGVDIGYLGVIKLAITLCKYIPQVYANFENQSTKGFSTTSVALDFNGGILSILQLFVDGYQLHLGFMEIIFGNFTKLGLGLVTIMMDSILLLQATKYKKDTIELLPK